MKTDKIDAKNISNQLKAGHLKKITIPEPKRESLRTLTRQRTAIVKDFRKIKSRIKSLLTYHHIHISQDMETPKWPKKFIEWLMNLDFEFPNTKRTLNIMLNLYK